MVLARLYGLLLTNNEYKFILGVNYWPRKTNIRMWRDWDENAIKEDLELMKSLGIRAVRFFIKNEDFADENANVFPHAVEKLRKFLDLLRKYNIMGFATLIVGHMSGKNWEIPWARPNEIYTSHGIEKSMKFIETIVREFSDHPAATGWILSNELSLVKRAEKREEALAFLRAFSQTVSRIAKRSVVSSGDLPDSYMQETPNVSPYVDYVGPHLYLYDTDPVRHGYRYGAMIELYLNDRQVPVILEEFGFSTYQYSEESQARFINEILYTALANRASGAFIWCFSDFIHESDPPYEWRPLELGFGIVRKDGSLKPAAEVVKRFASELEILEKFRINTIYNRNPTVSVIAPFYLFSDYEFVWYKHAIGFWRAIEPVIMSYILLSSSSIDSSIVYEPLIKRPSVVEDKKMFLMPSTIVALSSTWRRLLELANDGIAIYISLLKGFGEFRALHEAATHLWVELMGVENMLEAGSHGIKYFGSTSIVFVKDFELIRKGEKIDLQIPTPVYTYKVREVDAEVIAVDSNGNPVLFKAVRGKGHVYTLTLPIELIQGVSETMDWSGKIQLLFKSIALDTKIDIIYESSSPEVEVKPFYGDKKGDLVIAINHGDSKKVVISSKKQINNAAKVAGDANLIEFSKDRIVVEMPKKSAIIIHVA